MANKTIIKKCLSCLSLIAVIYMIFVYAWSASYTVFSADDFSHGVSFGLFKAFFPIHFFSALWYSLTTYLSWQGTYFSMFLQPFLSPINGFGYPQLKLVMIINAVLVMGALIVLIIELFQNVSEENRSFALIVCALTLFALFGSETYYEVFFWYSGSVSYTFPFSVMILGISSILRYYRTKEKKYANYSKILGFLACGGTLMIAGAGCYLVVIIVLFYFATAKKLDVNGCKIFIWWTLGALINTLAPGNYMRKAQDGSGELLIIQSIKNSVRICVGNAKGLIKTGYVLEIALLCLVIGIIIGLTEYKKEDFNISKSIVAAIVLGAAWFACFPATLGYSAWGGLNNRCDFVLNSVFIVSVVFVAVYFGCEFAVYAGMKSLPAILLLAVLCIAGDIVLPHSFLDNKYFMLNRQLSEGEIQEYYSDCKNFFNELEEYPDGADVKYSMSDMPKPIENTKDIYYYDDPGNPDNWMNHALAKYYGFNSFIIE
ncbi:DUF6056 family protein [Butyrivibrio sp. AE3006]|uniref:DUF6056 family protein n=1 Tax=Butyrivibrio sp. AE3006 TaxID=1280673 RepID=UPI000412373A|nr:DUF6056 family protein [Butyrivibrio sp. AE3006]